MKKPFFLISIRPIRDLIILLLWGTSILWLAERGTLSIYLHPSIQPYIVAAGFLLLLLAIFSVRGILVIGADSHESLHDHHCCCAHSEHGVGHDIPDVQHEDDHGDLPRPPLLIVKTLLLLLPLVTIVSGDGTKFSISTVQNRGVVQDLANLPAAKHSKDPDKASETKSSLRSSTPMPIQIIDLLYAVQMPSYREEFEGKEVEMTGQFIPLTTGNPKGDRFQAIRLFITCCAADAKPVGVTIHYSGSLKASEMGWVKITGVPTFPIEGGRRAALLEASKVEECAAPDEPFVY